MPTLPFSHAPVRAAVASMLRSPYHAGNLYPVNDIAIALNIAADITDGAAIYTTMLLCSFANGAVDEFSLKYDEYFHYYADDHVLNVCRKSKARSPQREEANESVCWSNWLNGIGMTRQSSQMAH